MKGTSNPANIMKSTTVHKRPYFEWKNVNQVEYFFGVNRIRIENDEELFDKLTNISSSDSEDKSISFGVYPTDLEEGFSFALKTSSEIQSE